MKGNFHKTIVFPQNNFAHILDFVFYFESNRCQIQNISGVILILRGTVKPTFVFLENVHQYVTVQIVFCVRNYRTQMIIIL